MPGLDSSASARPAAGRNGVDPHSRHLRFAHARSMPGLDSSAPVGPLVACRSGVDSHPRHHGSLREAWEPDVVPVSARPPALSSAPTVILRSNFAKPRTGTSSSSAATALSVSQRSSRSARTLRSSSSSAFRCDGGEDPAREGRHVDDLAELIVNDYRNNGRKSLWSLEHVRRPKLAEVFSGTKAIDITITAVERYKKVTAIPGHAAMVVGSTFNR